MADKISMPLFRQAVAKEAAVLNIELRITTAASPKSLGFHNVPKQ
jgi:hypothetical protein